MDKRGDHHDLLFHTVRIALDLVVQCGGKTKHIGVIGDTLLFILLADHIEVGDVADVLPAREFFVYGVVVTDVSDVKFCFKGLTRDVVTLDLDRTFGDGLNAHQTLDRRGLTGAVVPDKAEDLAFMDLKIQVGHGVFGAARIGLGEMAYLDHMCSFRVKRLGERPPVHFLK